jgi:hypothetical protein
MSIEGLFKWNAENEKVLSAALPALILLIHKDNEER